MSYQTLTRQVRDRKLRPVCEACLTATERPNAVIEHPPGEETQWDWLDLPNAGVVGVGIDGAPVRRHLACSGKWRGGVLAPQMTQPPRVVDGLDRICRGLGGGVSRVWRFDGWPRCVTRSPGR